MFEQQVSTPQRPLVYYKSYSADDLKKLPPSKLSPAFSIFKVINNPIDEKEFGDNIDHYVIPNINQSDLINPGIEYGIKLKNQLQEVKSQPTEAETKAYNNTIQIEAFRGGPFILATPDEFFDYSHFTIMPHTTRRQLALKYFLGVLDKTSQQCTQDKTKQKLIYEFLHQKMDVNNLGILTGFIVAQFLNLAGDQEEDFKKTFQLKPISCVQLIPSQEKEETLSIRLLTPFYKHGNPQKLGFYDIRCSIKATANNTIDFKVEDVALGLYDKTTLQQLQSLEFLSQRQLSIDPTPKNPYASIVENSTEIDPLDSLDLSKLTPQTILDITLSISINHPRAREFIKHLKGRTPKPSLFFLQFIAAKEQSIPKQNFNVVQTTQTVYQKELETLQDHDAITQHLEDLNTLFDTLREGLAQQDQQGFQTFIEKAWTSEDIPLTVKIKNIFNRELLFFNSQTTWKQYQRASAAEQKNFQEMRCFQLNANEKSNFQQALFMSVSNNIADIVNLSTTLFQVQQPQNDILSKMINSLLKLQDKTFVTRFINNPKILLKTKLWWATFTQKPHTLFLKELIETHRMWQDYDKIDDDALKAKFIETLVATAETELIQDALLNNALIRTALLESLLKSNRADKKTIAKHIREQDDFERWSEENRNLIDKIDPPFFGQNITDFFSPPPKLKLVPPQDMPQFKKLEDYTNQMLTTCPALTSIVSQVFYSEEKRTIIVDINPGMTEITVNAPKKRPGMIERRPSLDGLTIKPTYSRTEKQPQPATRIILKKESHECIIPKPFNDQTANVSLTATILFLYSQGYKAVDISELDSNYQEIAENIITTLKTKNGLSLRCVGDQMPQYPPKPIMS